MARIGPVTAAISSWDDRSLNLDRGTTSICTWMCTPASVPEGPALAVSRLRDHMEILRVLNPLPQCSRFEEPIQGSYPLTTMLKIGRIWWARFAPVVPVADLSQQ